MASFGIGEVDRRMVLIVSSSAKGRTQRRVKPKHTLISQALLNQPPLSDTGWNRFIVLAPARSRDLFVKPSHFSSDPLVEAVALSHKAYLTMLDPNLEAGRILTQERVFGF